MELEVIINFFCCLCLYFCAVNTPCLCLNSANYKRLLGNFGSVGGRNIWKLALFNSHLPSCCLQVRSVWVLTPFLFPSFQLRFMLIEGALLRELLSPGTQKSPFSSCGGRRVGRGSLYSCCLSQTKGPLQNSWQPSSIPW
jgi:hypothetical protein